MTVRFSRRALAQMVDAVAFIERDDPRAADAFAQRIERLAALLSRHPEVGRATDLTNVRVAPAKP